MISLLPAYLHGTAIFCSFAQASMEEKATILPPRALSGPLLHDPILSSLSKLGTIGKMGEWRGTMLVTENNTNEASEREESY